MEDIETAVETTESPSPHEQARGRQRSARRLRHEAQVDLFKKQVGDIEGIRKQLGLRPSEMSEILKVHPSAWTRWIQTGKVPPHIYQMLDWYLELLKWRSESQPRKLENHPKTQHLDLQKDSKQNRADAGHDALTEAFTPPLVPDLWRWNFAFLWALQIGVLVFLVFLYRSRHL